MNQPMLRPATNNAHSFNNSFQPTLIRSILFLFNQPPINLSTNNAFSLCVHVIAADNARRLYLFQIVSA